MSLRARAPNTQFCTVFCLSRHSAQAQGTSSRFENCWTGGVWKYMYPAVPDEPGGPCPGMHQAHRLGPRNGRHPSQSAALRHRQKGDTPLSVTAWATVLCYFCYITEQQRRDGAGVPSLYCTSGRPGTGCVKRLDQRQQESERKKKKVPLCLLRIPWHAGP